MRKPQQRYAGRVLRFVLPLLGGLAVDSAQAADEEIFFSEFPVVASVSRLPQRLADAPTAVTVIDREIIKASGIRDLNDIFRLVPGFQTFPNNTESARVSYHGLNDEEYSPRIQVLIDGQSQYSPLFRSGVNWLTIPVAIEDIERIEVVRGSNNVAYGNNSFAGVINIITVDPSLVRGVSVSASAGNQDVRDVLLRGGGKIAEVGNFRITYQQKSDDGITDRSNWRDFSSTRLLDARADFNLSDRDVLVLRGGRSEGQLNLGRLIERAGVVIGGDAPENPMRNFDQATSYLQLHWTRVIGADSEFSMRYGFRDDWASEKHTRTVADSFFDASGKVMPVLVEGNNQGGRSQSHSLEFEHRLRVLDTLRLSWGGGWLFENLEAPVYFYGKSAVKRDVERLFGSLEWRPTPWFTGNAGVSVDRDSLGGTHASPRTSANFHVTPENTLRVGYSHAYRTGSIHDYQGDLRNVPYATVAGTAIASGEIYRQRFMGDANLQAEELKTWEIGFLGNWKAQRASFDLRVFDERVPNRWMQLDTRYLDCQRYPVCDDRQLGAGTNVSEVIFTSTLPVQNVQTNGLEYQMRWQPLDGTRLMLSQAFIKTRANVNIAVDDYGNIIGSSESTALDSQGNLVNGIRVPNLNSANNVNRSLTEDLTIKSAPRRSTSFMIMQKLPYGLDLSLVGYLVGSHKYSRNSTVLGYHRYDGRLGYQFRSRYASGEVSYTVQNLNSTHGEYKAGENDPFARIFERRHWLTVRFDL
jgi:iron complex outermembrane receptor protein